MADSESDTALPLAGTLSNSALPKDSDSDWNDLLAKGDSTASLRTAGRGVPVALMPVAPAAGEELVVVVIPRAGVLVSTGSASTVPCQSQ